MALSSLGNAALTYSAEYGWPVFPVTPFGKTPLIKNGFYGESAHPEQIVGWWSRWPNANIGFRPGSFGLVVFDIDGPDGEAFAHHLGMLTTPTLECTTSRGRHLYFRLPAGVSIGNRKL